MGEEDARPDRQRKRFKPNRKPKFGTGQHYLHVATGVNAEVIQSADLAPAEARRGVMGNPSGATLTSTWLYEVRVGSRRFKYVRKGVVSYDKDGGGTLDLEVEGDLSNLWRAPVRVFCGYDGDAYEYFTGNLGRPDYNPRTGITKVEAHGVLGRMGRQYFDEALVLQGMTLAGFFGHIRRLLYDTRIRIEVKGGRAEVEDTTLPPEDDLREGAEAVVESFGFVMRDRPGLGLAVHPKPRARALTRYDAVLAPADCPVGQPEIDPTTEGPFAKVVVHRRDQEGNEVVWAEAKVSNDSRYKPRPNEIYWIHDFDGDQKEAQNTASETARSLTVDAYAGTVKGVDPRPLYPDSSLLLRTEDDDHKENYAAVVTECELDLVGESMSATFDALRVFRKRAQRAEIPELPSPYLLRATGSEAETAFGEDAEGVYFRLFSEEDYAGVDATGLYVDPSTETDEVGEDEHGLWVEVSEEEGE